MSEGLLATLGRTCRHAREQAGLRQLDIAERVGVRHTAVSRFELAESWPENPERMVEAYATETGVPAGVLWRRALDALDE